MAPLSICAFIVIFIIAGTYIQRKKEEKSKVSGIYDVDVMSGNVFEEYLRNLLISRGYKVKLTPTTGDYGADLILTNRSEKIVVQAKRYKNKVGVKAIQEVVSARAYYQADECWVITNNFFTEPAIRLGRANNVFLIDRKKLTEWMYQEKCSRTAI